MMVAPVVFMLAPFLRRARRRAWWTGLCGGAAAGFVLWGIVLLVGRFVEMPSVLIGGALWVGSGVVGAWLELRSLPPDGALIERVDAHFGLRARLRTAWELERNGVTSPFAVVQQEDALERVAQCSPEEWIPRLLPRWARVLPLASLLTWTPLLLPTRYAVPMSEAERQAVQAAAKTLGAKANIPELRDVRRKLERAKTAQDALGALAETEHELRQRAFAEAGIPPDAPALADVLAASGQDLPPELRERLKALREKLAGNPGAAALNSLLRGIETKAVSAEMLARIAQELKHLEGSANPDLAKALAEIREQKKAIALAAVDAQEKGRLARLDEVAGKESGEGVAEGARLDVSPFKTDAPTTLALESLKSASNREMRVFSREASSSADGAGKLLPFRQVVLSSQKAADAAIRNEALPATYRSRIRAYFEALSEKESGVRSQESE